MMDLCVGINELCLVIVGGEKTLQLCLYFLESIDKVHCNGLFFCFVELFLGDKFLCLE